jgi:hypothetical protein
VSVNHYPTIENESGYRTVSFVTIPLDLEAVMGGPS